MTEYNSFIAAKTPRMMDGLQPERGVPDAPSTHTFGGQREAT